MGRQADCNLNFAPHTVVSVHRHAPPSFKVELEGLLELVACDCVLMKERLRRADKAAGRGWEVLAGIRIIIRRKLCLKKKKRIQWTRASSVVLHSSLHLSISSANWHSSVPSHPEPSASYANVLGRMWFFVLLHRLDRGIEGNAWAKRMRTNHGTCRRNAGDFQAGINANAWQWGIQTQVASLASVISLFLFF